MRKRESPIPFPARVPFVESLGIELHGLGRGHAELRVDLDEAHLNTWEVAHGGVLMTLMDVAMALSARSAHAGGQGVATVEMKTSFLRPAQHHLRAVGKLLHQTATLAFCEAQVIDEQGHVCATASGTFKYLRGLKPKSRVHPVNGSAGSPTSGDAPADAPAEAAPVTPNSVSSPTVKGNP